ncbi:uncharacterized protein LOC132204523 [Neocloeon triangulifer]|uniref:uncharacterized protein LOC132204523 n=1 Tax=Neocloeon triangulifer TaxID=2078957 RepID=UPI00286F6405|nr:uncharacterized protein LOC132204523 [Neocloeon triangulifer]
MSTAKCDSEWQTMNILDVCLLFLNTVIWLVLVILSLSLKMRDDRLNLTRRQRAKIPCVSRREVIGPVEDDAGYLCPAENHEKKVEVDDGNLCPVPKLMLKVPIVEQGGGSSNETDGLYLHVLNHVAPSQPAQYVEVTK